MIIFLLSCTFGRLLPTQLEIGLVQFEQLAPNQVFEQIVHFEQPFYAIPKIALALQKTTYAQALFVKVHNITQENFVIQFYSTSVLNATYRYLATIDDRIEIQCVNSKIKENIFVKFQKPFTIVPHGLTFFTGFQQDNMAKLEIDAIKMLKQGVAIKLNSQNILTIGLCVVAGPFDVVKTNSKQQPKFGGLVSMKTSAYLSLIAEKALVCEDEECFQAYFQDEGTYFLLKDSPISEEELVKVLENPEPMKKEIQEKKPTESKEPLQEPLTNLKSFFDQEIMKKQVSNIFQKDQEFEQQIEKQNFLSNDQEFEEQIEKESQDKSSKIEQLKQKIQQSISPKQANIEDHLITQIIVSNKVDKNDISEDESEQSEDIDWYFSKEDKTSGSIDFQIQLTKLQEAIGNSKISLSLPTSLPEEKQWIQIDKQQVSQKSIDDKDDDYDEKDYDNEDDQDDQDDQDEKMQKTNNEKKKKLIEQEDIKQKNHKHNPIESLKALIQLDQQIQVKEKMNLQETQQENDIKQIDDQTKSKKFYDSPFLYDEPVVLSSQKSKIKIDREYADYEIKSAKKFQVNIEEPKATSEKLEHYIESFDKDQIDLSTFKRKQQPIEEKEQNQDPEYEQLKKDEEFLKFKQDYERKTQEKLIEIKGNMRKEKPKFYQDAIKVSPQEYRDFFFS